MWDADTKSFKKKKIGADGEIVNEDHKHLSKEKIRIERMQERYKKWKKSSTMNFQKLGDREVVSNTAKAKSSFQNRLQKKQVSDSIKRKKDHNSNVVAFKANKFGKKEGFFQGRKVKDELKTKSQITKDKAKKRTQVFGKKGGDKRGGKSHSKSR
jgi:hypothetical protein